MSEELRPSIQLFGAEGCHLCVEARLVAEPVLAAYGLQLDYVLIDADPQLEAAYRAEIPVLCIDGRRVAKYRVDGDELHRALTSRGIRRRASGNPDVY